MSVSICLPGLGYGRSALAAMADGVLPALPRLRAKDAEIRYSAESPSRLPTGAVFVCAQSIFYIIEDFDQLIFFNRTDLRDELWVFTEPTLELVLAERLHGATAGERRELIAAEGRRASRVFSVARRGTFDEALVELFLGWLWTQAGSPYGEKDLLATGYIAHHHWVTLYECLLQERARERERQAAFAREARANETEIIRVARELGLQPEPAGTGPVQWYARCPTTGHRLMISTSVDEFGCGYCRRKGGVEELRRFVAERNAKYRRAG